MKPICISLQFKFHSIQIETQFKKIATLEIKILTQ